MNKRKIVILTTSILLCAINVYAGRDSVFAGKDSTAVGPNQYSAQASGGDGIEFRDYRIVFDSNLWNDRHGRHKVTCSPAFINEVIHGGNSSLGSYASDNFKFKNASRFTIQKSRDYVGRNCRKFGRNWTYHSSYVLRSPHSDMDGKFDCLVRCYKQEKSTPTFRYNTMYR